MDFLLVKFPRHYQCHFCCCCYCCCCRCCSRWRWRYSLHWRTTRWRSSGCRSWNRNCRFRLYNINQNLDINIFVCRCDNFFDVKSMLVIFVTSSKPTCIDRVPYFSYLAKKIFYSLTTNLSTFIVPRHPSSFWSQTSIVPTIWLIIFWVMLCASVWIIDHPNTGIVKLSYPDPLFGDLFFENMKTSWKNYSDNLILI